MKKILLFATAIFFFSSKSYTQLAFEKGTKSLNVGVGLGNPYWGAGYNNSIGVNPTVSLEVGVTENISIGGHFSLSSASYSYNDMFINYKAKYTGILIGPRGSYHFATSEKLDPYVGATLGYVIVSASDNYGNTDGASSGTGLGGFVGVRYFTKPNFGFHAELGYTSFSFLTAGISLKF